MMKDELCITISQTLRLATRRLTLAMQTGKTVEDATCIRALSSSVVRNNFGLRQIEGD